MQGVFLLEWMVGDLVICVRLIVNVSRLIYAVEVIVQVGKPARIVGMSLIVFLGIPARAYFPPSVKRRETMDPIAMKIQTANRINANGHGKA
jgi:hypothetical protein